MALTYSNRICLLIGLATFVCYRLQLNLTVTSFVYLVVVVFQSLVGSFASSAVVSAVLCRDFFFTTPVFSLDVTNPLDILALISFLTTGLVITRLTKGSLVTHAQLLRSIWGPEYGTELDYLRSYVKALRKKIEENPSQPKYLLTEPWVGYRRCNPSQAYPAAR